MRGWIERARARDALVERLVVWRERGRPEPISATPLEIEGALGLFPTPYGDAAAYFLAAQPDAPTTVLPRVANLFHESLERRFTREDRTEPGEHPPLQFLRDSCLVFFRTLGAKAEAVAPDLLELLRRREAEGEFIDVTGRFFRLVLEAVLVNRPDLLTAALRSPVAGVREEICRVMADLHGPRAVYGPALAELIDDLEDQVAHAAFVALLDLEWADAATVERVRARILRLKTAWMREPFETGLRAFEKMASQPHWTAVVSVDPHDLISGTLIGRLFKKNRIDFNIPDGMGDFTYEVPPSKVDEALRLVRSISDLYKHLKWTKDKGENKRWPPRERVVVVKVNSALAAALTSPTLGPGTPAGRGLRDPRVADRIQRGAPPFVKEIQVEERDFRTEDMKPAKAHAVVVQLSRPDGGGEEIDRLFARVYVEVYP